MPKLKFNDQYGGGKRYACKRDECLSHRTGPVPVGLD